MYDFPTVKSIISRYGLDAQKSLGQNFLFHTNLTDKIVRQAGRLEGKTVIEIGPGPGALTQSILQAGPKKLIVIEKDRRCIAALNDYVKPVVGDMIDIIEADALTYDLSVHGEGLVVIANLPYNIGSKLLLNWLDNATLFESLTLMFQKEVVERICAKTRTKNYGRLSIRSQWLCHAEHCFDVDPEAFWPRPKVTSAIVKLVPQDEPLAPADGAFLELVAKQAFSMRRKTLKASLKSLKIDLGPIFEKTSIPPTARPEELSVSEFCQLSEAIRLAKAE